MKWGRLVVFLGVITLWPGTAHAAAGWWAWLEELSGPGPFRGLVIAAPVLCFRDGKVVSCFLPVPKNATEEEAAKYRPKRLLFVSVGWLGSSDHLRFKDLPDTPENRREVNVLQVSGTTLPSASCRRRRVWCGYDAVFRGGLPIVVEVHAHSGDRIGAAVRSRQTVAGQPVGASRAWRNRNVVRDERIHRRPIR